MLKRIVSACIALALAWSVGTAAFGESEELPAAPQESAAEVSGTGPETPAEKPKTPEQPAKKPEQSAEQPVEQPEQPAENPDQPAEQPEQPGENPDQPAEQPEQPGENPDQPAEQPEQPGENPEQPAEQPEQPGENPDQPAEQPEGPGENPDQPAEQPEQPAENPDQPAEQPEQPAENPDQPAEQPEEPGENPEQPEQPGENPDQPAEQPEQPGENPDQPAEQPDQPGENPDQPAEQPEEPGENPEQPEQPAEHPDQPAEQPEQPAETPEQPAEETPVCAHESTTIIYYFDFPDYRPLDAENHMVFGRAAAEVRCTVCGALLSAYMEDNAEEICAHVFQKGRCALCGKEEEIAPSQPAETAAPAVRESVLFIPPAEDNPSQYFCALTSSDLEAAGDTLVLRPDGCDTALVVQAGKLRAEIEKTGGGFIAEIERPGQRNVSATLRLYTADGLESEPEWQEISLRIYEKNGGNSLMVSYTSPKGTTSSEEAGWVGHGTEGYWNVTWLGNGIYEY